MLGSDQNVPPRNRLVRFCLCTPCGLALLLSVLFSGCMITEHYLIGVGPGNYPVFVDDHSRDSLIEALDRHLAYLQKKKPSDTVVVGNLRLTNQMQVESLATFRELVLTSFSPLELSQAIRQHFHLYQAAGRNEKGEMLVTGYYEPLFEGSLENSGPYRYPLYGLPDALIRKTGDAAISVGRYDEQGRLVPFWSRAEIETQNLLREDELVYLKDRLDAYLLQVQGSGRILLPDGTSRSLHFAGSNGREYNSLGKLFVDEQIMDPDQVSIESMRVYFKEHPEHMERMLFHNPRYIFFAWGDDLGPRGSLGQILTPQRSVAVDHDVLPTGAVGYLVSKRPVLDEQGGINHWKSFGRFVLPQDSGAAIKGSGRIDLFLGSGPYAELAAGTMKEPGRLYFLIKKTHNQNVPL